MTEPMNDAALDEIRRRNEYLAAIPFDTHGPDATHGDGCPPCGMVRSIGDVTALLGEVERMRELMAETGEIGLEWGVRVVIRATDRTEDVSQPSEESARARAARSNGSSVLICRAKAGEWREVDGG
ncbi:MAG: hypothetical protein HOW97_17060 [Catenulispora sp.]|nr:hypothetical protein [Catenulispora sp.]